MKSTLAILLCVFCSAIAFGSSEQLIRKQFAEYFIQKSAVDASAARYLKTIRDDGTWADIDYASQRRGNWPTRGHLDRLNDMAAAHADPESAFYQNGTLKQAVLRGLDHWIQKDYQNPNWYNGRIGVPYRLGSALVLMGDAVPAAMLNGARPILYRSELGMTGQNKVWCAGIGIMKGLLYDDRELLAQAVESVWSELQVSTGEGIQPDWSFHQHGPQQQFGNYGKSFGDDMVQWASVLRGTEYALAGKQLEILRSYLLEGPAWILWNGRMDLSGCGRQVDQGCQQSKARAILRQLAGMKMVDPEWAEAYGSAAEQIGFKPFWRSEMGVQRRPDWYASVKMSSTRVIGSESCNSENMLGLHLGDGVLFTHSDGREYEDIMPLWDWKRLPGTTCDQGLAELKPSTLEGYGGSDFSGVIGGGETGMAAMMYKRGNLEARKAYFFFQDHIVCLGAGIKGETRGPVYTSVEQSRLLGKVTQENEWVWHNGIGYQFLTGQPKLSAGPVEGNWNQSFPTRGDRPVSGEVFSLWIDHGGSPEAGAYAYKIVPGPVSEESVVLANTEALQAVVCGWDAYAVFYEAGKLDLGRFTVEADAPCLLYFSNMNLAAADPLHRLETLEIKVNGKAVEINLPQGDERGKQVNIK